MSNNNKVYFAIAGIVIITFALLIFIIKPLFSSLKESSGQLFLTMKELTLLESKIQQSSVLEKEIQSLKPDFDRIKALFVDLEMPIGFIQFLEETAESSGVQINISLLPQQEKIQEQPPFPFLKFQLLVLGNSKNCLQFLEKLENAPYLIEIESLSSRRITEEQLRTEKYQGFSEGDTEFNLLIKAFTK